MLILSALGHPPLPVLAGLAADLRACLQAEVMVGPPLSLPAVAFRSERGQYLASELLAHLRRHLVQPGSLVLGVTEADLFANRLRFVFGQAEMGGEAGVISLARLHPELLGDPPHAALLRVRILTEAMHELGHMLGAEHCRNPHCVMYFSHDLADTDRKGPVPCARCRRFYPLAATS